MTLDPYRATEGDEERALVPQKDLVIESASQTRRNAFIRMVAAVGAVTVVAVLVVNSAVIAAVVIATSMTYSIWHASRIRARGRIIFRIDQDALVIARLKSEDSIPLHVLDDIELETREVRKVGPDANPIAGLSFNQRVGPAVDVARIVIVVRKKSPMILDEEWISHSEASDSFRRLRLFLRSRGWIPRSERKKL